ncbi:hypothetical protein B0H15DRAFT_955335 [Mycena belliarum]|uniref:Uncharacterized protein n=1 Tax=Mycena belliarum TaxID=1033014 RepID=A0AAD6TTG5_9AGAR|nr:hypothetical protein B0H15DRAFT_955335 [Mycena belliae]
MSVLAPTTVASAAGLRATFPAEYEQHKVLLFPTGERAPFIVDIPKPPGDATGAAIGGLAYMPWLTGDAAAGPANHSYLEIAVSVGDGEQQYMTVVMTDQDHPLHMVLPRNRCIEHIVGGGVTWRGNVLAVRRLGGQLVDVNAEHIASIMHNVANLIRAEALAAASVFFVEPDADVHTDSE